MSVSTVQRAPVRIFDVRVARVERLSASFVRVWLRGPGLGELWRPAAGLRDLRMKIVVPPANDTPVPTFDLADSDWYREWLRLDESLRGNLRTYTLREIRGEGPHTEIAIDFVLHVPAGPASRWAARATVGDQLLVIGPVGTGGERRPEEVRYRGIEWNPTSRDCVLVADETALPAVGSILSGLDEGFRVQAFLEVGDPDDLHDLPTAADLTCHWFIRGSAGAAPGHLAAAGLLRRLGLADTAMRPEPLQPEPARPQPAAAVVWETGRFSAAGESLQPSKAAPLDEGYFWVAGEASMVTGLRRVLTRQSGVARQNAAFMGYWRTGHSST